MENYDHEFLEGASALTKGNYQEAISRLERALILASNSGLNKSDEIFVIGYFNLGQAKKASHNYDGAIADFTKAIECNPSRFENAYIYLAECCFEMDTHESMEVAIKFLNQCTKLFPRNDSAFMNKGIAHLKINDKRNAKIALKSAKQLGNIDAERFILDYFG